MKFQVILDGIESEGQHRIKQIKDEASRTIAEVNSSAEKSAGLQRNRILADGRANLNRECALIEQQATVQSLKIHADARQKLIDAVLHNVQEKFPEIRKRKDYGKFLSLTISEVVKSLEPSLLEDQHLILHFDERDKKLVEKSLTKNKQTVDVVYDLKCWGGCNGETSDGMVVTLNTIESRFERANAVLQQKLSVFFEEKISSM